MSTALHTPNTFRSMIQLVMALVTLSASATTRTVSNYPNHPAQHTSVQSAIDAAASGDTILVTGSPTTYPNFNITKPLTLIGAGHNNGGQPTLIGSAFFYAGSDNSALIGFSASSIYLNNNTNMSGIRIERCRTNAVSMGNFNFTISNLTIRNCMVAGMTLSVGCNNIQLTNNLFTGVINASNASNMIMSHNLFVNTTTGPAFQNLTAAVITDNIFWGRTPVDASVNNCSFNNNITYETTNNTIPYGTNTGANNLVGANPLFVNAPNRSGSLAYDYGLQAGSPGKNTAGDGTDIGIFGGGFAFIDLSGRARVPLVTTMTILNSSVPQGGTLDVQIAGTKVD